MNIDMEILNKILAKNLAINKITIYYNQAVVIPRM